VATSTAHLPCPPDQAPVQQPPTPVVTARGMSAVAISRQGFRPVQRHGPYAPAIRSSGLPAPSGLAGRSGTRFGSQWSSA